VDVEDDSVRDVFRQEIHVLEMVAWFARSPRALPLLEVQDEIGAICKTSDDPPAVASHSPKNRRELAVQIVEVDRANVDLKTPTPSWNADVSVRKMILVRDLAVELPVKRLHPLQERVVDLVPPSRFRRSSSSGLGHSSLYI